MRLLTNIIVCRYIRIWKKCSKILIFNSKTMKIKAKISELPFTLNVGNAHNDWVWLSHYAAKQYAKISYPQGTYLPIQLIVQDQDRTEYYPHPREKIKTFLEENRLNAESITALVKIRKGNQCFTEFEKGTNCCRDSVGERGVWEGKVHDEYHIHSGSGQQGAQQRK